MRRETTGRVMLSRYRLTEMECRLVFHLIKRIEADVVGVVDYRYTVRSLLRVAGMREQDRSILLNRMAELFHKTTHLNKPSGWVKYHWFDYFEWDCVADVLVLRFNDDFKPYLLQLRNEYTLRDFKKMNSCGIFPWTGEPAEL